MKKIKREERDEADPEYSIHENVQVVDVERHQSGFGATTLGTIYVAPCHASKEKGKGREKPTHVAQEGHAKDKYFPIALGISPKQSLDYENRAIDHTKGMCIY